MNKQVRIVHLEDSVVDAEISMRELRRNGFEPLVCRVDEEPAFRQALVDFKPDLILVDSVLPQFSGAKGMQIAQEIAPDIPLVVLSGTLGEEKAIELFKAGATDYVLKHQLTRLAPVIERALREASQRREHKRADEQVRKLFRAVEQSPVSILITDSSGAIEYVNPKFEQVTGYMAAEVLGRNPRFLRPSNTPPETYAELWRTISQGHEWQGELLNVAKNGELNWESTSISPIRAQDGRITHFIAVETDITAHKQSQQLLIEQARLLDLAYDAIMVRDWNNGKFSYWNRSAERVYGWSAQEALGRDMALEIFNDQADRESVVDSLLTTGSWQGYLTQKNKNGAEITVLGRATLIRDRKGQPKSVLIINTDVTAQKKLESQLLRTQRLESIGTLASGIAHDLNNILSPILMSVSLLRDQELSDESREELIKTIESSAQRGAEIVKHVLTFARGSQGSSSLLQLSHLISEIQKFAQETFPRDILIMSRFPRKLWTINGDATQIHQVLLNLCINARDAMPQGGELTLEAENFRMDASYASMLEGGRPGDYVRIKISDTGCGIAPEILGRIFDPFFTTKGAGEGTGLGLSTVAGILKGHEGLINVTSALGVGSIFEVYLPALADAQVAQERETPSAPPGKGELILVVDDEAGIRDLSTKILKANNYRVITAGNGTQGVAAYVRHQEEIAMVITDVTMPILDGIAMIEALRELNPEVRVIVTTGRCEEAKITSLESLGTSAVLLKPYTSKTLLKTLSDALQHA